MKDDIRLGRIAGFPLAINWSVLVVLGLLTLSLADGSLPEAAPGHAPGVYWVAGLIGALLFFGSLLAHEVAHAVAARRAGVVVKGLTLWLFGGVATLAGEAATPRADFRIAIVGPATSLGLAAGFGALAAALDGVGTAHIVVAVAGWLAFINLVLGIFNLVPGAPLDGGRVLRALLWHRHGDRARAAISAARAGRAVGYGLIGIGVLEVLAGASVGGLWLAFIGWFVLGAARGEEAGVVARQILRDVRVAEVMTASPQVAPGWVTVDDFIERYLFGSRHSAYPVEGFDGRIQGLVALAEIRRVHADARSTTRLIDIAVPLSGLVTATPSEPLVSLLEQLSAAGSARALVFEGESLVGILTWTDIARAIDLRTVTGVASPPRMAGRPVGSVSASPEGSRPPAP